MKRKTARRSLLLSSMAAFAAPRAFAQGTGSGPIRFIVGLGPGSGADTSTRFIAERLKVLSGQTTVTENRTGGDQVPAVMEVLRQPADGRTIMYITPTPALINPMINRDLPYRQSDLRPVAMSSRGYAVLVTGPEAKFRSLADVLAIIRSPEFAAYNATQGGAEITPMGGREFAEVIAADTARIEDALKP